MIYEPSYMQPYINDIDAGLSNVFSCILNANGGTTINGYTITINESGGGLVYTDTKTLTTPLYSDQQLDITVPSTSGMVNGMNYVWNIKLIQSNADIWVTYGTIKNESTTTTLHIASSELIKAGMYITIGNESKQILTYDSATGVATTSAFTSVPTVGTTYTIYSNYLVSADAFFSARTTPALAITSPPVTITSQSYTFNATYVQAQDITYKYFIWTLYDSDGTEIRNSGNINTGSISYRFDGFLSDTTYGVSVLVENQDGTVTSTEISYFTVSYASPDLVSIPVITNSCDNTALDVIWTQPAINTHTQTGTYTLEHGNEPYHNASFVLLTDSASSITYNILPNVVPYENTVFLHWSTNDNSFSGKIFEMVGAKTTLVAMQNAAPLTGNVGDLYYNIISNRIYHCVATNSWGATGYKPSEDVLYYCNTDSLTYRWNGTQLITTTVSLASATLSYNQGVFTYTTVNSNATDNVDVTNTYTITMRQFIHKWLLTSGGTPANTVYMEWQDNSLWQDTLFWTDGDATDDVANYWYVIALYYNGFRIQRHTIVSS